MNLFPRVLGTGTAVPDHRYEQLSLFENELRPYFQFNRHAEAIFRKTGVGFRHLAVARDFYVEERTTQARNEMYLQLAPPLGEAAVQRCLAAAGLSAADVDDFIVVSCTGIDTPGLDLILAGSLGMRPDLRRTSILGMGCYAALPGLSRARESVVAQPSRRTLLLALEICSLHFQPDDDFTENAVSSALFADGAAAVLVAGGTDEPTALPQPPGPRLVDFATYSDYQGLDRMAFHLTDHGFRMRLSSYVPAILAASIEDFVDRLLERSGLRRADVPVWAVHPGSAKILDYTQERLGLPANALDCSYSVLYEYGNMSSATILFILDQIQREGRVRAGDYGVALAFGPGLTIEGALLRW